MKPSSATVSVIMPVRNEADHIGNAIASVQRAADSVPDLELEILVIDGDSSDDTVRVVEELAALDPRIVLLANPQKTVPHAMNLGIKAAAGEVVIRLDGHAEIEPDFIANALTELRRHPECCCVGGPIQNVFQGPTSQAISAAMGSSFGVGNARFRTGGRDGYVDTVAFGAYLKADLTSVGLFDESLARNEDDELSFRLIQSGRKIWFSNDIRSRYVVRAAFSNLYRQYFQYGYWKVYVNRKHRTVTSLRQLAPPALVGTLVVLSPLSLFWPAARPLLLAVALSYITAKLLFALRAARSLRLVLPTAAAFLILHLGYGFGYLAGIRDFALLQRRPLVSSTRLTR